jgi:hypothetical protein
MKDHALLHVDWLIIYCFTSRSRIFLLNGDVTITCEGLQNLGLCSALNAFEQGGIFIVSHLLWHGASVFLVSSEGPSHSVASYDTQRIWRIYSNLDPHGSPLLCCFVLVLKVFAALKCCTVCCPYLSMILCVCLMYMLITEFISLVNCLEYYSMFLLWVFS